MAVTSLDGTDGATELNANFTSIETDLAAAFARGTVRQNHAFAVEALAGATALSERSLVFRAYENATVVAIALSVFEASVSAKSATARLEPANAEYERANDIEPTPLLDQDDTDPLVTISTSSSSVQRSVTVANHPDTSPATTMFLRRGELYRLVIEHVSGVTITHAAASVELGVRLRD